MDIFKRSIEVILQNQDKSGAYIASPAFPTYHYCWLRDGSFIANAMTKVGEFESARKYFQWVGSTIMRYAGKVEELEKQLIAGKVPDQNAILNTRFTMDGLEENVDSKWGNFQIDGYGTWLWALEEYVKISGDDSILSELYNPIQTTLRYMELAWLQPNYDCWEEHPEYLHPYSLAAVYGGFASVARLVKNGKLNAGSVDAEKMAVKVKEFILRYAIQDGKFVKHVTPPNGKNLASPLLDSGVDASLIALALPYNVFSLDNPVVVATIKAIESDLHRPNGGIYRYKADVYYGGGEWILLTAWLGIYYSSIGKVKEADNALKWIEAQADKNGDLAEQMSEHTLAPEHYEPWLKEWGTIAKPLLWSHAMYILLVKSIEETKTRA